LAGLLLHWVFGWGTVELTLSNLTVLIRQCNFTADAETSADKISENAFKRLLEKVATMKMEQFIEETFGIS